VCNGNATTPNLLNRFIRCETASGTIGGSDNAIVVTHDHGAVTGNQSVSHTHTGTSGNQSASHQHETVMGRHTHTAWSYITSPHGTHSVQFSDPGERDAKTVSGSTNLGTKRSGWQRENHAHTTTTGNQSASHTHSITSAGASGLNANIPAYYSLIFIIRIS